MTGHRVIIDYRYAVESHWRTEWAQTWKLAVDKGWTTTLNTDHGALTVLHPDADCRQHMGSNKHTRLTVDIREQLKMLQRIGGMRGWWTDEDPYWVGYDYGT